VSDDRQRDRAMQQCVAIGGIACTRVFQSKGAAICIVVDVWQVLAIVKHGGSHLVSNLVYLDTFQICTNHADNLRCELRSALCKQLATFVKVKDQV